MNANGLKDDEIAGFDEAGAAALFANDAKDLYAVHAGCTPVTSYACAVRFMLQCQMASLIVDTFLAGVLMTQVFSYYTYQGGDKWWTKLIVAWASLWCFAITCYYWVYMSYLFVDAYGKWLPWLEVRWLALMPLFDVMVVSSVQGFFAYRAYLLVRRNKLILALIVACILAAAGGGIGLTIVFGSQSSLLGATHSGPTIITWTSMTTAADILIAACILWGLLNSKSGWTHTDRLITRLVRLTFEARLPPTFLALAYVIEWSQTPSSLLGAVFQALQSKAYTVGLLFTLNARITFTANSSEARSGVTPQVYATSDRRPTQLEITVQNETFVHDDPYNITSKNHHHHNNNHNHSGHTKGPEKDSFSDDGRAVALENGSRARLTQPEVLA